MAGRRGARSGRGWDAIPPRAGAGTTAGDDADEPRRSRGRRGRRGAPDSGALADPDTFGVEFPSPDGEDSEETSLLNPGWAGRDDVPIPGSGGAGRGLTPDDGPEGAPPAWGRSRRGQSRGENASARSEPPRSESEVAREICLRQLAVRPRTRAELTKALLRKEISEEVIAEVLDRYDEVGIIDDAAFARAWVSSRHHGRGLARRALANELRQRGVDAETAGEALEAVDDEAESEAARALVDRKLRSATGAPDAIFRRLVGMLARKGYPAGVAIRAVKDALAARDAEAAEFADAIDADALADEAEDPQS
jgi:regulatory protein